VAAEHGWMRHAWLEMASRASARRISSADSAPTMSCLLAKMRMEAPASR
jgi:hypothetical protein